MKTYGGYDVKLVTEWKLPDGNDLRSLISMPNLPKPTHGDRMQPRTIFGATTWNRMRNVCYEAANFTCEICGAKVGVDIEKRQLHSHELFQIDYKKGTSTFVRCVALCAKCHLGGLHTGRAYTLHRNGNVLYPKDFLLEGARNAFSIAASYNEAHPESPIRLYKTWIDYLKCEDLREEMERLIKEYGIKFYAEDPKKMAKWADWKVIIGDREYPTPYKNE